jgi:type II secretory pathway component PulF
MSELVSAFRYRAVDGAGRRVHGQREAPSADALLHELGRQGLVVIELAAASGGRGSRPWRRTSADDLLEATRAMAALLRAGVPLARALDIGASIVPPRVARELEQVRARVSSGVPLATALAGHPHSFSPLYCGVVRAGERSGNLGGAFTALAGQLEATQRVRARLLSAAMYPLLLAVAGTATIILLVQFVLPRFADLLLGAHATIPRSTAALLAFSGWFHGAWPILLVAVVSLAVGLVSGGRTERGRRAMATLLVETPLVGRIRRHVLASRFARLLAALLGGGAPLLTALDDTMDSLSDPLARDEVARVRARVREGRSLHGALEEGHLFPPVLARLVAVGDEAGTLRDFLARSAEMSEERVEHALQRLVTFVEPAMIVLFGVVIAFVALSLLQAIYGVDASAFR